MISDERRNELMNGVSLFRYEAAKLVDGALVIYDLNHAPPFVTNPYTGFDDGEEHVRLVAGDADGSR